MPPPPPSDQPPRHEPAGDWVRVVELRDEAEGAVGRGARRGTSEPLELGHDGDLRVQLVRAVGADRAARLERRVKDASKAFTAERYPEARSTLAAIAREAPSVVAVRELLGLTLYRMGRWRQAAAELEAFRQLTGRTEQHPVLADCYRAMRRYEQVDALWEELREVSPDADLVMEGRIVAAGAAADRGDLLAAVAILQPSARVPRRPQERHLRKAYALGDLYERLGDVPRARQWFRVVADHDPEYVDVRRRLRALGA